MRRGLIGTAVAAFVIAAAFAVAPGAALAASPQDICKDLQDGKVDGNYSLADWQAFLRDPTVQGYCPPVVVVIPPTVKTTTSSSGTAPAVALTPQPAPARKAAVKGAQHTVTQKPKPAPAPVATSRTTGSLPLTGADLSVFAVVGLALIAIGLALRSTTKRRGPSPRL
jgi:LPXTG-motif cell wall-anchored protein